MSNHVHSTVIDQLSEHLSKHMGLYFQKERRLDLLRGIREASEVFGFQDVETFIHWIMSTELNQRQVEVLARFLTVGETYFMREKRVFEALDSQIIPDLLRERRMKESSINIWSAGCCTGEEPYSVAIMLDQLIPDIQAWNISILGTDINPLFLQKANRGIYTEWSFRGTPASIRERYFKKVGSREFMIIDRIKQMIHFSYLNLAKDPFRTSGIGPEPMDIIFCRNVLMYFKPDRVEEIVNKFYDVLNEDGWLIVGPSESAHIYFSKYESVEFPGAILFRKSLKPKNKPEKIIRRQKKKAIYHTLPTVKKKVARPALKPALRAEPEKTKSEKKQVFSQALQYYREKKYQAVAEAVEQFLTISTNPDIRMMLLLSKAYANLGRLEQAMNWCTKAINHDKLNPRCYHLQGSLFQEQDRLEEAAQSYQRVLYLNPDYPMAHFMLGNVCRQQGKVRESNKYFSNVLSLLNAQDKDSLLPDAEGITVGGMLECIKSMMNGEYQG